MSIIDFYVFHLEVVEVRSFRGAESWWGGSLAWVAHSLRIYVIQLFALTVRTCESIKNGIKVI
jgi:hypothetical protein